MSTHKLDRMELDLKGVAATGVKVESWCHSGWVEICVNGLRMTDVITAIEEQIGFEEDGLRNMVIKAMEK